MKTISRKKNNYTAVVLIVLAVAIIFGFLFDFVCTQIELIVYPKPEEYREFIKKYAHEYGVSEELIYAVIKTESGFDSAAVSHQGAIGLMQMMPDTFEWLSRDMFHENLNYGMLYDPQTNIKYGTYYLARLYSRFGDWDTAIAAYNGGEGNVDKWLNDSRYSDDGIKLVVGKIPVEETRNYVKKVNKAQNKYHELYNKE